MDILNLIYLIVAIPASLFAIWAGFKEVKNYFLSRSSKKNNSQIIVPSSYQSVGNNDFKIFDWKVKRKWAISIIIIIGLIGLVTLSLFINSQSKSLLLSSSTDTGYNSEVNALSWSPDGKRIAIASFDGVYLWDVAARRRIVISTSTSNRAVAWSPDENFIAFGGSDTPIQIWNVTSGEMSSLNSVYSVEVNAIAWSPNGKLIAFGGSDGKVGVYGFITKKIIFEHPNIASVTALSWSHDGDRLASGGEDGTIHILDSTTGKDIIQPFHADNNSILSLAWSPTNGLLGSAGNEDARVQIWDTTKNYPGNQVATINNSTGWWINGIAWSPHDNEIASVDNGGTLRIWDALSGDDLTNYSANSECGNKIIVLSYVIWSPDGKSLAFSHNENKGSICEFQSVEVVILCRSLCIIPSAQQFLQSVWSWISSRR